MSVLLVLLEWNWPWGAGQTMSRSPGFLLELEDVTDVGKEIVGGLAFKLVLQGGGALDHADGFGGGGHAPVSLK